MAFRDAADFFDPDLVLSWRGKEYRIPSISAEVGVRCQALISIGKRAAIAIAVASNGADGDADGNADPDLSERDRQVLTDVEEVELYQQILGPVWQQLHDDGAPWALIKHMANTAMAYFTLGEEAAVEAWDPKAPNRETRRAAARNGTAGAGRTRRAGSTNGTSSRRAKSPASASQSPGGPSSPTGT
jgi:hypothetical protein